MNIGDRLFQILLTLSAALLTAAVPAYVAYDLWGRGAVPEKRVELNEFLAINPIRDLSSLGDKVSLSFRMGDQTIDNLVIARAWLTNAGTSPILPSDFYQNISVNVEQPWKILAVEHEKTTSAISFKWKKINDTRFEAEPALLNPGDRIYTNIYLTNTQFKEATAKKEYLDPNIVWNARIVNLRGFTTPPNDLDRMRVITQDL